MQKPTTLSKLTPLAAVAALFVAGCGGGGGGGGTPGTSGDFLVLRTDPPNNARIFLNEPISMDLSNSPQLKSATFDSVAIQPFDLNGNPLAEVVSGNFRVVSSPGDSTTMPQRRLQFLPTFPTNDTYDNGGFKPGRLYLVQLVQGNPRTGVGLIDKGGKGLAQAFTLSFTTADGTTPSQLFADTKVGGPRGVGSIITPRNPVNGEVALNELGQRSVEIRLRFDQPLNPNSANVPFKLDLDPTNRDPSKRGRIFLEYDDRDGKDQWIPAEIDLEANTLEGSIVVLRPVGILPNDVEVRIIVESTLEDMSGESNVNDAAYNRVFGTFQTESSYELRFDAMVDSFDETERLDLGAPFLEPLAEVVPGAIKANFDFEGRPTNLRYEPNTPEVILNTDLTQITPKGAPKINVAGGVFEFRSVLIPDGVTVKGTGSNPMIWLVLEDFTVKGRLLCEGGKGQRVDTLNSANFPTAGGVGVCGGGNGGEGSPNSTGRSSTGETGFGPGQVSGGGGQGGRIFCSGSCGIGSGGGGGSYTTKGDPWYKAKASGTTAFIQQKGQGGYGCNGGSGSASRTLAGGLPGPVVFKDTAVDNNFWGSAVDVWRQIRINGELAKPIGGAGGGGGGDYSLSGCTINDPNFINDEKGGGGGGGGGVIIIKALGKIMIDRNGIISAAGGGGGGGAWAGANTRGGGGGGGSAGMVVLMAGDSIELVVHGTNVNTATYAADDFDFSVSADGGVGTQGVFSGTAIVSKYVPPPNASQRDARPSGGMGGQGIIQLMAPPGTPGTTNVDGTNTVLDDNIHFRTGTLTGSKVTGSAKQSLLAWRGLPDDAGVMRDDNGNVVTLSNNGDGEGDMRPAPTLMPAPFGNRSRMRSKWQDLGFAVRRMTTRGGDGNGRGVNVQPNMKIGDDYGPRYFFSGTNVASSTDPKYGFIAYESGLQSVSLKFNTVATGKIAAMKQDVFKGQNVYQIRLVGNVLGSEEDLYSHYIAQFKVANQVLAEFRILGHDANTLYVARDNELSANDSLPANATDVIVLDKFFHVYTGNVEGFPQVYPASNNTFAPKANVQIGFAFHKDPGKPDLTVKGEDQNRFPKRLGTFIYDVNNSAQIEQLRNLHMRYMQWDLLFDTRFQANPANSPFQNDETLSPLTPRPEVRRLVVPYRY